MALKLKRTPRDVKPQEIHDLVGVIYSSISPWMQDVTYSGKDRWTFTLRDPDSGAPEGTRTITARQILTAVQKAQGLCCRQEMEDEELGYGCALDADLVMQTAIFGEVMYG